VRFQLKGSLAALGVKEPDELFMVSVIGVFFGLVEKVAIRTRHSESLGLGVNVADELTSQEQIEDDDATVQRPGFGDTFMEIFNPLEAVEVVFEDPRAGLVVLVVVAGVCAVAFIACGVWSAVQELLFGGGPPMGLGLK